MTRRNLSRSVIALLLLACGGPSQGQSASSSASSIVTSRSSKPQFFAGVVVEADARQVRVSRNLVGRPTETRVFSIDAKTKTPKNGIKLKTRVTVRYQHLADKDLALEIQVRPSTRTPKPTI